MPTVWWMGYGSLGCRLDSQSWRLGSLGWSRRLESLSAVQICPLLHWNARVRWWQRSTAAGRWAWGSWDHLKLLNSMSTDCLWPWTDLRRLSGALGSKSGNTFSHKSIYIHKIMHLVGAETKTPGQLHVFNNNNLPLAPSTHLTLFQLKMNNLLFHKTNKNLNNVVELCHSYPSFQSTSEMQQSHWTHSEVGESDAISYFNKIDYINNKQHFLNTFSLNFKKINNNLQSVFAIQYL